MRVRILGAGVIGLSCADELLRRGHDVTVVDPRPGRGASYAAAGMLSPSSEVWHGEEALLELGLRSIALWPGYAARLGVPLHRTGTLLVGRDHGDLQRVGRQVALLADRGTSHELLDRRQVAALEPTVGGRTAGGALLPDDHSVEPRDLVAALLARISADPGGRLVGVAGSAAFDATVVATGARLPTPYAHLVHGVRGEAVRVRTEDPPRRTVRGWVHGEPVYVVPRPGGEAVIGATSEQHDSPPVATVGGVARLLDSARSLMPGLDAAELVEVVARDRPATADHLPLVGPAPAVVDGSALDGRTLDGQPPAERVVLAAGHYRHGVLLAPLTAVLVADHLDSGHVDPQLDPRRLDPRRLDPTARQESTR